METTIALLLHYFPGLSLEVIYEMSKRQIYILINEVSNVNEIFMGNPNKPKKKRKTSKNDIEIAKNLGCKNPEELLDARK